ncbi:MAG: sulfotransferase [Pseudomonadota bacterium]
MKSQERLRAAYAAYQKGDLKAALVQAEAALKALPRDPNILQFAGVVSCQAGATEKGADYLQRALDNGGDTVDNRINLAKALSELGRWKEALQICAVEGDTSSPDLQRMHADLLKAQGRPSEAVWVYERLVYEQPNNFEAWNNLGNARHESGDLDGAIEAFQKARLIDPNSSLVHTNLARVLISKDRYEDACLMLEKAALLAPGDQGPLLELGRALTSIDHPESALRALGDAARIDPSNPKVFVAIGQAFTDLSQLQQAERAFKFALQADASHVPAYLNLGILLEKANRVDELRDVVSAAESKGLSGSEIDYLKALLLSRQGEHEAALQLLKSLSSPAINAATQAQLIGQLADRLDRVDEAFLAYEDMNNAMAQSPLGSMQDRNAYQRAIDRSLRETTAEWVASWPEVAPISDPPSPVFLVGFPRSGTTLLDTILMGHSGTHVLEEIPIIENIAQKIGDLSQIARLSPTEVADLRKLYFAELEKAAPAPAGAMVIDKNPLSMIRMPLIHRLFPDAKIIFAMRHPCDVVLSCYMQNFKPTEAMSSFLDLANASRTYDRIFAYWEKSQDVLPLNVHMLRYEAMVEDVEAEVRPLFEFLGLEWQDSVLDHQKTAKERGYIRTPSYAQVTEKIYSSASGRWQRYRKYMNEVLPILEPWAKRFGYSMD